jgi:ankyrin repeat protein
MKKQFLATIATCLVLTGCMSSGPADSTYNNCSNICNFLWWKTATVSTLKAEIKSGADVNARSQDGTTPLHIAARLGKSTHIKILTDAGANVNALGDSLVGTPLHKAATMGHPASIKALIDAGADVNMQDEYLENTPLHEAVTQGSAANVRVLLNAGANPNIRNRLSENPFVYASSQDEKTSEWPEIRNLLKSAGSETKKSKADVTKIAACGVSQLIFMGVGCGGNSF